MLNKEQSAQVSDTTGDDSSNAAKFKNTHCTFYPAHSIINVQVFRFESRDEISNTTTPEILWADGSNYVSSKKYCTFFAVICISPFPS